MPKQKPTTLLTISLPRAMAAQVERIRKAEQRGRSELVREALRTYFALARNFPVERATVADIRAMKQAPRESERGETTTLEAYIRPLPPRTLKTSKKRPRPTSAR